MIATEKLASIPVSSLPHESLVRLFTYWRRQRGDRWAPPRAEIDPVDMPRDILPDLLLTEVVQGETGRRYRFRLVGSRVTELAGRDPSWQFLDETLPREFGYRAYIVGLYDTLVEARQPIYSRSSYLTHDTGQYPERETHRLMLPLVDQQGEAVTHVLAAQVFHVHSGVTQKPFLAADNVTYGDTLTVHDG